MSELWRSISDAPSVAHSATARAIPAPSLIHTAATDQSPFTSGVSPRIGIPSGVSESSPLIACRIPAPSTVRISGISSSACSSCGSKSSDVNGSSVGESADSSIEGMSSGDMRIARCAYEPTSMSLPFWRSYMFVSTSRTIGNAISPRVSSKSGIGPTVMNWCTAGVSGIEAPAMRAIRGLHTPQATKTVSASISPSSVRTRRTRPFSVSIPVTSRPARIVSAPSCCADSRISVPARSGSTTETPGVYQPPRITPGSTYGTCSTTPAGVSSSVPGSPHAVADDWRRCSSSSRSSVRATSTPPLTVSTPSSSYWRALSFVSAVISFEWSTGKMKFEAWPGRAAGVRQAALLDQDEVAPAEPGEVVDEAVADDAGADDDGARGGWEL